MNITDFLLARIAQDEQAARKLAETDRRPVLSVASTVNHPARVLAECAAKRAIVEAFDPDAPDLDPYVGRDVIAMLATVYSDHPDYQEEWKL